MYTACLLWVTNCITMYCLEKVRGGRVSELYWKDERALLENLQSSKLFWLYLPPSPRLIATSLPVFSYSLSLSLSLSCFYLTLKFQRNRGNLQSFTLLEILETWKKCFMVKGGQVEWRKTTKITPDRFCCRIFFSAFVQVIPLEKL